MNNDSLKLSNHNAPGNRQKEKGISLLIALVTLLILTLLGTAAVTMSSQDLIIAANEQQQIITFQETESVANKFVKFNNLVNWLKNETLPDAVTTDIENGKIISDFNITRGAKYPCMGISGEAMSLGPDAPICRTYNFAVDSHMKGTGVRSRRNRGEGKELPNKAKGSYL